MNKNTQLKIANPLLALVLTTQLLSGWFGEQIGYDAFEIIHEKGAWAVLAVALWHIWLNKNWVLNQFKKPKAG